MNRQYVLGGIALLILGAVVGFAVRHIANKPAQSQTKDSQILNKLTKSEDANIQAELLQSVCADNIRKNLR